MPEYPQPYWADWAEAIKTRYSLKQLSSGEWHGPCPSCGGTDRFWIKEQAGLVKAFCRQGCTIAEMRSEMEHDGVFPSALSEARKNYKEPSNVIPWEDVSQQTYNERKGIDLIGATLRDNAVVVPIFNAKRQRIGAQTIAPDGEKRFSKGLQKEGAFGVCGKLNIGITTAYVAEGYATAASVKMSTGLSCVFALDAGNMAKVCEALDEAFPALSLIIAADNDEAGRKAARQTGKRWAAPKNEGDDWNDIMLRDGKLAVKQGLALAKVETGLFTRASDIEMTPPKWLIEGMLEQDALAMLFGASGTGKTFVALDAALHIAAGKTYHGKEVEQAPVLYVAGEGHAGFARRIGAWAAHNDVRLKDVPFYKSTRTVILNDEQDSANMMSEIDALVADIGNPKLIVLDTMDRTLAGSDSDDKDAAAYLNVCDQVRLAYGCTVMVVHHTGHNHTERARGSTRLKGRLDAEYRVESWGDTKVMLTPTKMKDAEEPEAMTFLKVTIELTTDNGQKTDSLALEYTEDKPADKKNPDFIKRVILEQILKIDAMGEAPRSDLKEAVGLELECSQRTANRHIKRLVDDGVISSKQGIVAAC